MRAVRRRRRRRRRAGQQRRHHGRAVRADRRRLREPDRHQPPRPLRADQPAAAEDHRPGGHGVVDAALHGLHQPDGPELEVAAVLRRGWPTASPSWPTCCSPASCSAASTPPGRRCRAHAAHPGYSQPTCRATPGKPIGATVVGVVHTRWWPPTPTSAHGRRCTRCRRTCPATASSARGSRCAAPPATVARSPLARDAKKAAALWELSEQLTGTKFAL